MQLAHLNGLQNDLLMGTREKYLNHSVLMIVQGRFNSSIHSCIVLLCDAVGRLLLRIHCSSVSLSNNAPFTFVYIEGGFAVYTCVNIMIIQHKSARACGRLCRIIGVRLDFYLVMRRKIIIQSCTYYLILFCVVLYLYLQFTMTKTSVTINIRAM